MIGFVSTSKGLLEATYSEKYQEPTTAAQATRRMPLATPQLHNHTTTVPAIAQCAQPRTIHILD